MGNWKASFTEPQNLIAVGVTIISLCALVVSLQQTRIMQEERELIREYSRASVWPRIEFGVSKGHNPEDGSLTNFVLSLTNSGVGPAIITDVKVTYNDEVAEDWWHLFELQGVPDTIETYITNSGFNGRILKIGETLKILDLSDNPNLAQFFMEHGEGISIDIYYESIYKEKWKFNTEETIELDDFEGLPEEEQFKS
ncbi:MAG: hypothetical protein AAFO91_02085 [Bacteroidota bacterium]